MRFPTLLLLAGGLSNAACEQPGPQEVQPVRFEVTSGAGFPISGAVLIIDGQTTGTTTADGLLEARLPAEQDSVDLELRCPEHHDPERFAKRLLLQNTYGLDRKPVLPPVRLRCDPTKVVAAIIVRSGFAQNVPVLVEGHPAGDTGEDGVFHFLTRVPWESTLRVELDTSGRPELNPTNPGRTFTVHHHDTVLALDAEFIPPKRSKPKVRRASTPARRIPYRID